jgi:general secretion pathway protein B
MSLILEALKKSERQRRLGEAPSLGSPVMSVRRRRSLLPPLAGLIVVALVVAWWLQREPAVEAPPAPTTAALPAAPTPAATPAATGTESTSPAAYNRPRAESTAASRLPRSKVPPDANAGIAPDLREKLKSGELVVANPALLKPGEAATIKESEAVSAENAAPTDAESATPTAPRPPPPTAKGAPPAPATAADATVKAAATAATPPVAVPAPGTPAAGIDSGDGPALIWALPYAQRRGIPELKLSMHVFAGEPANRFVIVNGNRQVEGDEFEGLKLIEIRNDGIVLEHDGVRFVYPRGGR